MPRQRVHPAKKAMIAIVVTWLLASIYVYVTPPVVVPNAWRMFFVDVSDGSFDSEAEMPPVQESVSQKMIRVLQISPYFIAAMIVCSIAWYLIDPVRPPSHL